jgi:hypothetical protein
VPQDGKDEGDGKRGECEEYSQDGEEYGQTRIANLELIERKDPDREEPDETLSSA